jgi:hypothetical protein
MAASDSNPPLPKQRDHAIAAKRWRQLMIVIAEGWLRFSALSLPRRNCGFIDTGSLSRRNRVFVTVWLGYRIRAVEYSDEEVTRRLLPEERMVATRHSVENAASHNTHDRELNAAVIIARLFKEKSSPATQETHLGRLSRCAE